MRMDKREIDPYLELGGVQGCQWTGGRLLERWWNLN